MLKARKTRKEKNLMNICDFNEYDGMGFVQERTIPKQMSEWLETQIRLKNYATVKSENRGINKRGFAMKTQHGTIVFFPDWNCKEQFSEIVMRLRKK